jgi:hypothetical protein
MMTFVVTDCNCEWLKVDYNHQKQALVAMMSALGHCGYWQQTNANCIHRGNDGLLVLL